ncbi:hypothetical protein L2E82_51656 [Cichorium intybus]|nr:hypothetical protein L2E82_51656 [Cichorium intybus]
MSTSCLMSPSPDSYNTDNSSKASLLPAVLQLASSSLLFLASLSCCFHVSIPPPPSAGVAGHPCLSCRNPYQHGNMVSAFSFFLCNSDFLSLQLILASKSLTRSTRCKR